jgi:hypothetical protein
MFPNPDGFRYLFGFSRMKSRITVDSEDTCHQKTPPLILSIKSKIFRTGRSRRTQISIQCSRKTTHIAIHRFERSSPRCPLQPLSSQNSTYPHSDHGSPSYSPPTHCICDPPTFDAFRSSAHYRNCSPQLCVAQLLCNLYGYIGPS